MSAVADSVPVQDVRLLAGIDQRVDEVAPDETGATGYDDCHRFSWDWDGGIKAFGLLDAVEAECNVVAKDAAGVARCG